MTLIIPFFLISQATEIKMVENKLQLKVVIDFQLLLTTGGRIRNVELQKF